MNDITARQVFVGQYQFVDVWFEHANEDVTIKYDNLREDDVNRIRWIDVSPNAGDDGVVPQIYRLSSSQASQWRYGIMILRCNQANYRTRLLLFTERN